MPSRKSLICLAVAAVLISSSLSLATAASPIGEQIKEFTLSDHLGTKHSLGEWKAKRAVVVVFLGVECPLAKLYASRLNELALRYRDR